MATAKTERRHREGLKAVNLYLDKAVARHVVLSALDSGMTQQAWMTLTLALGEPFLPEAIAEGEVSESRGV